MLSNKKYLAAIISPEVLSAMESGTDSELKLKNCNALEIRYDFFEESLWPTLSERVFAVAPMAMQIGTIRLQRDGGVFFDERTKERMGLWGKIFESKSVPNWIDLEYDFLHNYQVLNKVTKKRDAKILISQHNFEKVPTEDELKNFAIETHKIGVEGLKIAAMPNSLKDCEQLYEFTRQYSKNFNLFAAFGMGDFGKLSRIWSLKEGANLTYASTGKTVAPGLIDVVTMSKALKNLSRFNSKEELSGFLTTLT